MRGLKTPLRVRLPLAEQDAPGPRERVNCSYFDEARGAWRFDGVAVAAGSHGVVCEFRHLTDFGAMFAPPRFNQPNWKGLFQRGFEETNAAGFYFAMACLAVLAFTAALSLLEYRLVLRGPRMQKTRSEAFDVEMESDYATFELQLKAGARLNNTASWSLRRLLLTAIGSCLLALIAAPGGVKSGRGHMTGGKGALNSFLFCFRRPCWRWARSGRSRCWRRCG